jgi:hypothetical protein
LAATPKLVIAALPGIDTRRTAASHWVGLRAPHPRLLFWRKRVSRKQRHVRFGQIPFIAHFRGGGRNHLLLSLLDTLRPLGCYTVRPLCRPEKGHRDLTSLSIVAVRAGWWLLKLISLHPELRVGMRRRPRKQQVTMGLSVEQR